jgi:DNA-binding NtrC family response regulator
MMKALASDDYLISEAEDGGAALDAIRRDGPDLVFLDLAMPRLDGLGVLRELSATTPLPEIIVVTADDSVQSAVKCIQLGAADYITKPYEVERLRAIARRAARRVELQQRLDRLQTDLDRKQALGALVGVSRAMRELFSRVERAAKAPLDILIRGETGTGKELLAREIHRLSDRSGGPFVAVNTAAIAESLAESELFGHVRGSFTGASADRRGVFEQAHGGTLFLDEIGDMPPPTQTKILRALQERVIQPVGSSKTIPVDVRVISATHQDLQQSIDEGHFRSDLYFRIKGIELHVPPLRQRREDVILLADYFLDRLAARSNSAVPRPAADAVECLLAYSWPGNVRELEHAVTAAAAMAEKSEIRAGDLQLKSLAAADCGLDFSQLLDLPLSEAKSRLVETFERQAITTALARHNGNISAAARQLGIHRQSLQQKMEQLRITR